MTRAANKIDPLRKMFVQSYVVMLLSTFVAVVGTLIDGALTGGFLGDTALSALGLCTPLLLIAIALAAAFSTGGQILCTRHLGKGDLKTANEYFSLTFFIMLIYGVIICGFIMIFPGFVADILGASKTPELKTETVTYLCGVAPSVPMTVFMMAMLPFVQLDGGRKNVFGGMILMVSLNIIGDLLNVFVFHGGMLGMGIATSVSSGAALLVVLSHFLSPKAAFRISFRDAKWSRIGELFKTGAPTAMQRVYSAAATLALNRLVLLFGGAVAVAAHSAKSNFGAVCLIFGASLAPSVVQMVSMLYGEEDVKGIERILKLALRMGVVISGVLTIISFVFAGSLMKIYLKDSPETLEMAVTALRMYAFVFPLSAVCDILAGYCQAMNNRKIANLIPLLEYLVLPVTISLVLGKLAMGINGVWLSYVIAEILTLITVWTVRCISRRRFIVNPLDLADIEKAGFVSADDIFIDHFVSVEETISVSEEMRKFCIARTDDERLAFLLSLATEELGKNIVQFGFADNDGSDRFAEVRLIYKDGRFTLRIRDNGKRFDPKDYYEQLKASGETGHIGIRLIYGMADDIEYVNTLSYNNLIISRC